MKFKLSGGIQFLIIMVIFYLLVFVLYNNIFWLAIGNFKLMLIKVLPMLIVVFAAMVGINVLLKDNLVKKYLGKGSGLKGWVYSAIVGILVSAPPYVLYPMLKDVKDMGAKNSLIALFLYNRNVKIPFIPVLIAYFGWEYTVILSLLIIVFSFLNGYLVGLMTKITMSS